MPEGRLAAGRGSPVAVNKTISSVDQVLADALIQKIVTTNVAASVARVSAAHKETCDPV